MQHFNYQASVCMWICRGLNLSLLLSNVVILSPPPPLPLSVPFQLDTVPSCSCSDHYWPGIQDYSTVGGLWLSVKSIPVSPRVYSSMCITIKNKDSILQIAIVLWSISVFLIYFSLHYILSHYPLLCHDIWWNAWIWIKCTKCTSHCFHCSL